MAKYCPDCNTLVPNDTNFCPTCGHDFSKPPRYEASQYTNQNSPYAGNNAFDPAGPEGKSRGIAALLAIFIGSLGIHYFYCGKNTAGVLTILLTVVTCGIWSIIPFVQGIYMLCITNEEFERKYVTNPATFPVF
ncbi:MAG: NINE protein [Muribaculaceae bacterium]|nr:NINE protein [Muribaculaceae bacterium]